MLLLAVTAIFGISWVILRRADERRRESANRSTLAERLDELCRVGRVAS